MTYFYVKVVTMKIVWVFLLNCLFASSFTPQRLAQRSIIIRDHTICYGKNNASNKGFGKVKQIDVESETERMTSENSTNQPRDRTTPRNSLDDLPNTDPSNIDDAIKGTKMFQSSRERSMQELELKRQKLREEDELLASDPSVGAVPEIVANRMITRIAAFFGVPVFGGLMIFVGAYFYSKKYDLTLPPVVVAYATQLPFILGLAGITYGILSSSWDEVSVLLYTGNINEAMLTHGNNTTIDNDRSQVHY